MSQTGEDHEGWLRWRLAELKEDERRAGEIPVAALERAEHWRTRAWVAKVVVGLFVTWLAATAAMIGAEALFGDRPQAIATALEALQRYIVPALTLVLGYYLGTHGR